MLGHQVEHVVFKVDDENCPEIDANSAERAAKEQTLLENSGDGAKVLNLWELPGNAQTSSALSSNNKYYLAAYFMRIWIKSATVPVAH